MEEKKKYIVTRQFTWGADKIFEGSTIEITIKANARVAEIKISKGKWCVTGKNLVSQLSQITSNAIEIKVLGKQA